MYNRKVKFGLKSPNHLGKMSLKFRGWGVDSHWTQAHFSRKRWFLWILHHGTNRPVMVRIVHGTNSPGVYEKSTVRTVQGTKSPGTVRTVHGTNSPRRYEQSTVRTVQEGTNSPWNEQSKVRKVQVPCWLHYILSDPSGPEDHCTRARGWPTNIHYSDPYWDHGAKKGPKVRTWLKCGLADRRSGKLRTKSYGPVGKMRTLGLRTTVRYWAIIADKVIIYKVVATWFWKTNSINVFSYQCAYRFILVFRLAISITPVTDEFLYTMYKSYISHKRASFKAQRRSTADLHLSGTRAGCSVGRLSSRLNAHIHVAHCSGPLLACESTANRRS